MLAHLHLKNEIVWSKSPTSIVKMLCHLSFVKMVLFIVSYISTSACTFFPFWKTYHTSTRSNSARTWLMDFRFLSQQNTHPPQSFHSSSSSLFWFSCQRTPTQHSSSNLFLRPTTEEYYYQTSDRIQRKVRKSKRQ